MAEQTNNVNATRSNDHLKIYFPFNRFVREAFVRGEDGQDAISSYKNIVGEGNIVARVFKASDPVIENPDLQNNIEDFIGKVEKLASVTVSYDQEKKVFLAMEYGFITLRNKRLEILPLLSISPDQLKAYIFISQKIDKSLPSVEEIKKIASKNKILHLIEDDALNEEINRSQNGKIIQIAQGRKAINGHIEFIELNRGAKNEIGKELEGGRIDYKEKDSLFLLKKGAIVARKIQQVEPEDGYNVFGNMIAGEIEGKNNYYIGKNISTSPDDPNVYLSNIDGGVSVEQDGEICVEERIVIEGDVNIETGNIHFNGFVEIEGNITKGFTVDAGKDISVKGNIEDATVSSKGSIYVTNGIIGEKANVFAKKNVSAKFIQSASIKAGQDINVIVSIVKGNCVAEEYINVEGKVVGGQIYGCLGVNTGSIGSLAGTRTLIETGIDESKLNSSSGVSKGLQKIRRLTEEITSSYGKDAHKKINIIVSSLSAHRKEHLLSIIAQIKDLQAEIKLAKEKEEQGKNSETQGTKASVTINKNAYAGAIIKINHATKKIEKTINMVSTFTESSILREKE